MNPTLQIVAICAPIMITLVAASWKLAWIIKDMEEKLMEKIASIKSDISGVQERVTVLEYTAQRKGRKSASIG